MIVCSEQAILPSLIRNNLNRYLKNPLFTKSFVRTSIWPGEQDDPNGVNLGLIASQNAQISEFIKSQNKFTNDHVLEPYGNFDFDLLQLNNQYASMMPAKVHQAPPPQPPPAPLPSPVMQSSKLIPQFSDVNSVHNDNEDKHRHKSLTISALNTNAYSDTNKLESLGKTNLYSNKVSDYKAWALFDNQGS